MEWLPSILPIITLLFGGGVLGVVITAIVNYANAKRASKNEARRDTNTVWDQIVANLQQQITVQTENFTKQMEYVTEELRSVKAEVSELKSQVSLKDRLLARAIAHFSVLEALIPESARPVRPEGLE
jgi:hypothetical protein